MKKLLLGLVIATFAAAPLSWAKTSEVKDEDRIRDARVVLQEILNAPDRIPRDTLDKARCLVIVPSVVKAAFIVGGSYGHGVMVCRTGEDFTGPWGSPSMMALEGGSIGFQIGGEATDFIGLVMTGHGADALLHSKVKLGADISGAAGPVGRTAEANTDATLRAEILTYSRARGAFAGVSLEGASLRPDNDANRKLYGREVSAKEIVSGRVQPLPAARDLDAFLQQQSPALHA